MELSNEDNLRLNVLLAQNLQAVRIDESKMTVLALTEKGEASVPLNPTGRDEQYLKKVRELFSTQVLGSPGGYPVYLDRWTRSSQARADEKLQSLLLLGEPEAVVAVVHAPSLSPELARRAWWAMPESHSARCMLAQAGVANSEVGRELAQYLIEYLPFETEPKAILDTVRLVLQPGLADDAVRETLWKRATRNGTFYIGFLRATPDDLPETGTAHADWPAISESLSELVAQGNPAAQLLCKVLSPQGQAFLKTVQAAMDKLANEDSVVALFDLLGRYFDSMRPDGEYRRDSEAALAHAQACIDNPATRLPPDLAHVLAAIPEQRNKLVACLTLAQACEPLLVSFFSHSDTVGALMRRKLKPWTEPMLRQIDYLCG